MELLESVGPRPRQVRCIRGKRSTASRTTINRPILAVWRMIDQRLATDDSRQTGKKSPFDCFPPFIIRRSSASGRVVQLSRGQQHATSHLRADSRNILSSPIQRGHHWPSVSGHPLLWWEDESLRPAWLHERLLLGYRERAVPMRSIPRTLRKVQENREEQRRRKVLSRTASSYRSRIDEELFCWLPLCGWGDPVCKQGL